MIFFRSAHTLKGMAATMGYDVMTQLTHKMENIFELFKTGTLQVTQQSISLIFKCLDRLSELVEDLRKNVTCSQLKLPIYWPNLTKRNILATYQPRQKQVKTYSSGRIKPTVSTDRSF